MSHIDITDVMGALQWRYATKVFDASKKIPDELLDALLSALVLSPSSFGMQPWKFIVVNDPALRESLQPHSWNQTQVTQASHFVVLAARKSLGAADVDDWIARLAEVRAASTDSLADYRAKMIGFISGMDDAQTFLWTSRQAYIALGQLMTCSAMVGVDSCPMEGFSPPAYDAALGLLDSGYRAVVACALGYRSEADTYALAAKVRYPRERVIETR